MTFLEAALEILKRERRPLHFKELTEKATERKLLTFVGRTPEVTMQTQLTAAVKKAPGSPFVRVKPGVFGLLRYPEAPPEPEPEATPEKPEKSDSRPAAGEPRAGTGRRRRRGGRGRRRGRGDAPGESVAANGASGETANQGRSPVEGVEDREAGELPEEPEIGSLTPEARAAALAESGVLEGNGDERDAEEPTAMRVRASRTRVRGRSRRETAGSDLPPEQSCPELPDRHPAPAKGQFPRPRLRARAPPRRPPSRDARSLRPSMQP
jgi:hypothetical protein